MSEGEVTVTSVGVALAPVTADEAKQIAIDTYIYAYPLVLMDVTQERVLLFLNQQKQHQEQHR